MTRRRYVADRRGPGFAPRRGFTVTDTRTGDVVEPATLDANGVPVSRWTRDRAQRRARELNEAACPTGWTYGIPGNESGRRDGIRWVCVLGSDAHDVLLHDTPEEAAAELAAFYPSAGPPGDPFRIVRVRRHDLGRRWTAHRYELLEEADLPGPPPR